MVDDAPLFRVDRQRRVGLYEVALERGVGPAGLDEQNPHAELIDRFGRVDVLVNNAGIGSSGATEEPLAQHQNVFDINVFGVIPSIPDRRRADGRGCRR
ncbi:SDR family NAD(P)-dependent oxidoreductase [Streptomyces sp. NPDC051677]|uniref:SDR family NAD(P)-dependent oxidoreductase n=1 Tax=Streptomyces sp. NPDC051677 TaxID=3365669 RepID=UPI0037D98B84